KIRDKLEKVKDILEKQKVAGPNHETRDIINYCIAHGQAYFNLFQVRGGKLIGQENFILKAEELDEEEQVEVLEAFLKQYYELATDIPKEILIPHEVSHQKELAVMMSEQLVKKVRIIIPIRGDKNKMLEMSLKNAIIYADRNKPSWEKASELTIKAAEDLQKILKLKNTLKRIECYDISHLSGTETVGSMVVFEKGAPKKDMYRKFKMRTVENKPDDYKSMEEVLYRRLQKLAFAHQFKDYKLKKARKKDNIKIKGKEKTAYILVKEEEIVGQIAIREYTTKIAELTDLEIKKKHKDQNLGHKIIREAVKKAKAKRIYVICKKDLKEYYQILGFEEIKKTPKELEGKQKKTQTILALDKLKHKEDKSFSKIPDLIVIDGGKGQLGCGEKILKQLNLDIPYISLAKQQEEIFIPGRKNSIILQRNNEALKLIQRARDEAHRFAITYNKKLRSNKFKRY
ncbi:GNAT family N-acetyltransferase, partial [Candidatus Gracilibacteria bacterium]|nr:GNAT family N-acetyltransferase [Candidatus Gracilibacteria bacterium]